MPSTPVVQYHLFVLSGVYSFLDLVPNTHSHVFRNPSLLHLCVLLLFFPLDQPSSDQVLEYSARDANGLVANRTITVVVQEASTAVSSTSAFTNGTGTSSGFRSSTTLYVGVAVGGIFVVVVIATILLKKGKRQRRQQPKPPNFIEKSTTRMTVNPAFATVLESAQEVDYGGDNDNDSPSPHQNEWTTDAHTPNELYDTVDQSQNPLDETPEGSNFVSTEAPTGIFRVVTSTSFHTPNDIYT
eukprot:m.227339 g.227339  ORF g.227339 m.227339 type:complete len:242 (-) comp13870_c0_seq7:164-889(-)